jgi:malate dehydrogenase (oxaloacetate-decarboxylating)(NADP+)
METGVATRPLADMKAYKQQLDSSVFKSSLIMRPLFDVARQTTRRLIFAEGEDERVLRCAKAILEEMTDRPILIGRPEVIAQRIDNAGLKIEAGKDFDLINPEDDPRYRDYWREYHHLLARRGITTDLAKAIIRTNSTAIGAMAVKRGDADCLICGTFGEYLWHLRYIDQVLGSQNPPRTPQGALSLMIIESGPLFIADTQINAKPNAEQIAQSVIGAARHVRRFGEVPKIALCSNSMFGNMNTDSGRKMREAMAILDARKVDFLYDGEMNIEAALDPNFRSQFIPDFRFDGPANTLIFSNTDAASAVRNILKTTNNALEVGPILMGMGNTAHIVTPSVTARGLLNIAAIAGTPVESYD